MNSKITLPIAIVLGSLILGGFFYAVQINKQQSIEKQQQIDIEAKAKADEAKVERDTADATFANNLKCQTLLKDLKNRWNNVVGIYYSELQNTCIVKFTDNGEVKEGAVEDMQDTK